MFGLDSWNMLTPWCYRSCLKASSDRCMLLGKRCVSSNGHFFRSTRSVGDYLKYLT